MSPEQIWSIVDSCQLLARLHGLHQGIPHAGRRITPGRAIGVAASAAGPLHIQSPLQRLLLNFTRVAAFSQAPSIEVEAKAETIQNRDPKASHDAAVGIQGCFL